jgi:hypothetical protein
VSTDVIGIDHIYLTVYQASERYYDQLMPLLGFKKAINSVSLRPAKAKQDYDPYAPGLRAQSLR